METVKVKRDELLSKVKANREAHQALFDKAQAGFRARVVEELDRRLTDAREGRKIDIAISLPHPVNQTKGNYILDSLDSWV